MIETHKEIIGSRGRPKIKGPPHMQEMRKNIDAATVKLGTRKEIAQHMGASARTAVKITTTLKCARSRKLTSPTRGSAVENARWTPWKQWILEWTSTAMKKMTFYEAAGSLDRHPQDQW